MSLQLKDIGPLPLRPTVVSASLAAPPWENGLAISGVGPQGVAIPELGVAPLVDSGTDLEDELSTPDDSPSTGVIWPEEVFLPDVLDFELEKALLQLSILSMMVSPIVDPVVESPGSVFVPGATPSCTDNGRADPCVGDFSTLAFICMIPFVGICWCARVGSTPQP